MSDSRRFLVTGGAGFIGSHIVTALLARGHRVVERRVRSPLVGQPRHPRRSTPPRHPEDSQLEDQVPRRFPAVRPLRAGGGVQHLLRSRGGFAVHAPGCSGAGVAPHSGGGVAWRAATGRTHPGNARPLYHPRSDVPAITHVDFRLAYRRCIARPTSATGS